MEERIMTNKLSITYWIAVALWIGLFFAGVFFISSPVNAQESRGVTSLVQLEVREALVAPYLEQIKIKKTISDLNIEKPAFMKVWIMADDRKGSKIYFNQETKKFGMARYAKRESPFTSDNFVESNELPKVFMTRK
jgi:hypothetical protein